MAFRASLRKSCSQRSLRYLALMTRCSAGTQFRRIYKVAVRFSQPFSNTQDSIDLVQEQNAAVDITSHFSGVTVESGLHKTYTWEVLLLAVRLAIYRPLSLPRPAAEPAVKNFGLLAVIISAGLLNLGRGGAILIIC